VQVKDSVLVHWISYGRFNVFMVVRVAPPQVVDQAGLSVMQLDPEAGDSRSTGLFFDFAITVAASNKN